MKFHLATSHDVNVAAGDFCAYCASVSPLDAIALLKTPGTTFAGEDFQNGWPQTCVINGRRFYNLHLKQLSDEQLAEFDRLSRAAFGIGWHRHPARGLGFTASGELSMPGGQLRGTIGPDGRPAHDDPAKVPVNAGGQAGGGLCGCSFTAGSSAPSPASLPWPSTRSDALSGEATYRRNEAKINEVWDRFIAHLNKAAWDRKAFARTARRLKYSARSPGFLRMTVCGWRFVLIDSTKHRPCYSDRTHGWRVGRFLFRVSPPERGVTITTTWNVRWPASAGSSSSSSPR